MKPGFALFTALTSSVLAVPSGKFKPEDIIERDVVVLGGGAAGVYAATRLRDYGKSVVIIEKESRLGGHVHTYSPPGSPIAIDYGVIAYLELPGVRDFFGRFGIELMPAPNPPYQSQYVDFKTGQPVTNGVPAEIASNPQSVQQALGTYGAVAGQYLNITFPSLSQLPVDQPLPEDLTLPFGDFVQKYNIQAALPTLFTFLSYIGDILRAPTSYVFNQYSALHLNATANKGLLVPTNLNNSVLYDRAAQYLGEDVLFASTVIHGRRTKKHVKLIINSGGCPKLIKAKKLVVTIPPLPSILKPLNLDKREHDVFKRWIYQASYVGVLTNTGLPDGLELVNFDSDASPRVLNLPGSGGVSHLWNFVFSGLPGLYRTNVIGAPDLDADGARKLVSEAAASIAAGGVYNMTEPYWLAFGDHKPLQTRFGAKDIEQGSYQEAFALNGYRSTFYAGAAWASDYTSVHWAYLESVILPQVLQALQA